MNKKNCWEHKECGRNMGGNKAAEMGVCPATLHKSANNANGGKNGGRICWAVAGTFCEGEVQGSFVEKYASCRDCDFYKLVKEEEGASNFSIFLSS